jgi:opacity protein-like surface antigen
MKRLLALLALMSFSLSAVLAADIAGTWKGTADGPNGSMERTFVFKVDGSKLTGETTSSMLGKSEITDGKVDGDAVSFTISVNYQGNDMKINYKGKAKGNEMELTAEVPGVDQNFEWHVKKVS